MRAGHVGNNFGTVLIVSPCHLEKKVRMGGSKDCQGGRKKIVGNHRVSGNPYDLAGSVASLLPEHVPGGGTPVQYVLGIFQKG